MTLLAAFQVLLSRLSAQQDVIVATPTAGRLHPQTDQLIGLFVNTLLIRTALHGDESFTQLLKRVKDTMLNAYTHQGLPFDRLISDLYSEPTGPRLALARIGFALQNAPMQSLELDGLSLHSEEQPHRTARNDLSLVLHEANGSLRGAIEYSTDLFDGAIAAMVNDSVPLRAVTARPTPVDTIDLTVPIPCSTRRLSSLRKSKQRGWTCRRVLQILVLQPPGGCRNCGAIVPAS
jgi:non-ribosomal peptide synthetase component F